MSPQCMEFGCSSQTKRGLGRHLFVAIPLLLLIARGGESYMDGSGITSACSSMTPGHGVSAQTGAPPFKVTTQQGSVVPGGSVSVTVTGDDGSGGNTLFKGFMLQARYQSAGGPEGTWESSNQGQAQRQKCGGNIYNMVSHNSAYPKNSMTFTWRAPSSLQQNVTFVATFVKAYNEFWVKVESTQVLLDTTSPPITQSATTTVAQTTVTSTGTSTTYGSLCLSMIICHLAVALNVMSCS